MDPFLVGKWKTLEAEIKSEIHDVNKLLSICSSFKIDFENKAKDKNLENNNNILLRDYLDNNNMNNNPSSNKEKLQKNSNNNVNNNNLNDKKWDRFGGRPPFSHGVEDPFENNNNNINNEIYQKRVSNKKFEENYVNNKKIPSEDKKEVKDPMVWDPPEDRGIKNSNKAVAKPRQSNAQVKPAVRGNPSNVNPYK